MTAMNLKQLSDSGELQRGTKILLSIPEVSPSKFESIVEFVKPNFLVLSMITKESNQSLLGKTVNFKIDMLFFSADLHLEVISEQLLWPVQMIGLIPTKVSIQKRNEPLPLVKPDFIINVPYKVMGAKPSEEKGEGVILEFSPTTIILGTDGFLSKGDFVNLSFFIPRTKQQISGMTKVVDKKFDDGSAVVTLAFTDIDQKHSDIINEYYKKFR